MDEAKSVNHVEPGPVALRQNKTKEQKHKQHKLPQRQEMTSL